MSGFLVRFLGKKAVSEVISVILVVLMGIALAGTAYMWGIPIISKRQDTTKVERVYTYFERSNSNSLVRKIEFIAKNGGEDTFTPDVQGLWTLYEREEIGSDLVGYWKFDGDGKDSSSYGNDGIFIGETFNDGTRGSTPTDDVNDPIWVVTGKYGKALEFDGVDDNVDCGQSDSLNSPTATGKLTIAHWLYLRNYPPSAQTQTVSKNYRQYEIFILASDHMFRTYLGDGTNYQNYGSGWTIPLNEWHHLVVTANGTNVKFYVDGQLKNTLSQAYPLGTFNTPLYIGRRSPIQFSPPDGTIDEVRIWNRALTEDEIQAEMESSRPIIRPVAAWSFEEGSGQYANDTHIWTKGEFGSASSFDGIDDYVDVTNSPSLDINSQITITAWIKPLEQNNWNTIAHRQWSGVGAFWLGLDDSGILFALRNDTGERVDATYIKSLTLDEWYFVAATYDGSTMIVYLNGDAGTPFAHQGTFSNFGNYIIGTHVSGGSLFNGTIDQVRVYNRALTETEIRHLMLESSNSIEFITFAKVSNIAISDPGIGIGWVALTSGGSCPPASGLVGFDPPYVVCAKGERFSEGFNIIYRVWFRELYESTGVKGYKINLIKHPSGQLSSPARGVRISREDVSSVVQDGKTLIITEIKILLV